MIIWFVHNDFTFTRFIELKIIDLYGSGLLIVLYEQLKYQKFALNTGSRGIIIITTTKTKQSKAKKTKKKKTGVVTSRKSLNPPVLTDVDSIDSWLHDLQIWRKV